MYFVCYKVFIFLDKYVCHAFGDVLVLRFLLVQSMWDQKVGHHITWGSGSMW